MKNIYITRFTVFSIIFLLLSTHLYAQKNSEKGDKLFDKNLFNEAIPYYDLEIKSNNSKTIDHALLKLADCYRITGEFEKAEATYKILLKKKKKDPNAVLNYAISLKSSSKYAEAAIQFTEYLKLNPSDPMGEIFLQSCDLAQVWLTQTIGKEVRNVEKINSSSSDFAPVFKSPHELVYSSSREGSTEALISLNGGMEMHRLDLYDVDVNSIDEKAKTEIGNLKAVNSPLHEGPATFSKDGKELYFTRTINGKRDEKTNKVLNTLQVYYSVQDSTGKWSKPASAFSFNSSAYSVGQPSISTDGKTIYFMSDMPGGFGETDIYFTSRQKDGTWSSPANLGSDINSFGHELFPYISENGILYFSSDTRPGMGQLDIFSAELINGKWEHINNLKPPINSIANDFGIALDGKNMRGFFSSDRFNGKGAEDIYSFSETIPLKLTVNGGLIQFEDKSIYDGIKYKLIDNISLSEITLEPKEGNYSFPVKNSQSFTLVAKKNGFSYNKIAIQINRDTLGNQLEVKLKPSLKTILINGYLLARSNETPLENISISLSDSSKTISQFSTLKNGYFEFLQVLSPAVSYTITTGNTLAKQEEDMDVTVYCKGIVSEKGMAISGATVQLFNNGKLSETMPTNNDGAFIFELIPNKSYSLFAYKPGYDTSSTTFTTTKQDVKKGISKNLSLSVIQKNTSLKAEAFVFKGNIKDSTGNFKNVHIFLRNNNQIIDQTVSGDDGSFKFNLLPDKEYTITASSKGYMDKDIFISTKENIDPAKINVDIKLDLIKVNAVMVWDNILFVSGKSNVTKESLPILDKLLEFMRENPNITIELGAHTDTRGDAPSNLKLSQERAQYVKNYLTMEDVTADRVVAVGYGESKPLIPNEKNDLDYQKNRRTEIRIIKN